MARNKQRGGGRGPLAGVNTKDNYPADGANGGQQNGNFYCVNHGHNSSHNTAHCTQTQGRNNNNSNNNYNNQRKDNKKNDNTKKITCINCGKFGHFAADCKSRNYRQQNYNQSDPPPAYTWKDASQNNAYHQNQRPNKEWEYNVPLKHTSPSVVEAVEDYCKHCNERGHNPTTCENIMGMYAATRSKLFCSGCRSKGHLLDDCKNPISKECTRCQQKGHRSNDCKISPNTVKLEAYFRMEAAKSKRFQWNGVEVLHPSQEVENDYMLALENARLTGSPLSAEDHAWHYSRILKNCEVFETNIIIETAKKLAGEVTYNTNVPGHLNRPPIHTNATPIPRPDVAPLRPSGAAPGPNVATRSSTASIRGTDAASRQAAMDRFRRAGFNTDDIKTFEQWYDHHTQVQRSELEQKIDDKIKHSLVNYNLEKVNTIFTMHEAYILQKTKIQQEQWDLLKASMLKGASFYRDNRVMQMLFDRKVPRCKVCNTTGTIFDRWLLPVPIDLTKKGLLALEDFNDWGLFVGMQCTCASNTDKFDYVPCSLTDLESLPESER